MKRGDVVSIHSEDRPEWMILDMAAVAIRGVTTGMYPTNPAAEVQYLVNDSGAIVHFAEDQEQVDKVARSRVARPYPDVRTILYVEPRGVVTYDDDRLMFWDDFLALGDAASHRAPRRGRAHHGRRPPDDVMTLVYTSGTTGPPKGAMLTNANADFCMDMVVNADGRAADGEVKPIPSDEMLTYLPLCHVAERIFSTWTMVVPTGSP